MALFIIILECIIVRITNFIQSRIIITLFLISRIVLKRVRSTKIDIHIGTKRGSIRFHFVDKFTLQKSIHLFFRTFKAQLLKRCEPITHFKVRKKNIIIKIKKLNFTNLLIITYFTIHKGWVLRINNKILHNPN